MLTCEECNQIIAPPDAPVDWGGRRVCAACHQRLSTGIRRAVALTEGDDSLAATSVALAPLDYAVPLPPGRRPAWVWVVVGIYLAILLGIATLPELAAWDASSGDKTRTFITTGITVSIFFALGWSLIAVPVRARRNRPLSRRSVWIPLIGSILLFGALCAAAGFAALELLHPGSNSSVPWLLFTGAGLVWMGWTIFFAFLARSLDPLSLNTRLYKSLFVGSVLELLVAVPMHLVVRRRSECCAGIVTGMAICVGALVAILALGPGVFFLYRRRWKETYEPASAQPRYET